MFVELILYNCYKKLKSIPRKDYITLIHTSCYLSLITLPIYYEYYNALYVYFTLIYTQWIILGGCIIRGDDSVGEPCDFVRSFYILGILDNHQYQEQLTYISENIAVPSYIYCGFKSGYGLKSYIYPIIFMTKFNKQLNVALWDMMRVY